MDFVRHYASDEISTSWVPRCGTEWHPAAPATRRELRFRNREDFQKLQGERSCCLPNFIIVSTFLQGNGIHAAQRTGRETLASFLPSSLRPHTELPQDEQNYGK
jgi:hypothetical protein